MTVDWRKMRLDALNKLYDLMGEDQWLDDARVERVAQVIDVSASTLSSYKAEFGRQGIVETKYVGVATGTGGRKAKWRLPLPRAEAIAKMNAYWDEHGGSYRPSSKKNPPAILVAPTPARPADVLPPRPSEVVAIATSEREEVRAIAGPDTVSAFESLRPMRKSEGAAQVEAVRQYKTRFTVIVGKVRELEALGVRLPENFLADAMVDTDPVMEAQSQLLPYITELEGRIANYEKTVASLQEQVRGVADLRSLVSKQKQQIDRLIAEKVARAS